MRQRINCKTIPPCKTIFEKVGYIYQILFNIRLIKKKTQSVFRIKPHLVDCVVRIEKKTLLFWFYLWSICFYANYRIRCMREVM